MDTSFKSQGGEYTREDALFSSPIMPIVCLNFKVPLHVRQHFKIYAAQNNMTMTELLLRLMDEHLPPRLNPPSTNREKKK